MAAKRKPSPAPIEGSGEPRAWPAYTVERWPIERLTPYGRNARRHSTEQLGQLRAAIRTYGWTVPILAREDGTVIAGHGRLEAGRLEGIEEVPVIVARGWTEAQCRAYALADNKIAENSTWDDGALGIELADLRDLDTDISALGFSEKELRRYLNSDDGPSKTPKIEASYQVLIECADEAEQLAILEKLDGDGLKCRALIA